jgi:hypothetical protein
MPQDVMEPNCPTVGPTPEHRKMLLERWNGHPQRKLPPPEELERVQSKLLAAALKGKAEFNRTWSEIFHGKYPSPGVQSYVKPGLRKT